MQFSLRQQFSVCCNSVCEQTGQMARNETLLTSVEINKVN